MTAPPAGTGWTRWLPGLPVLRTHQRAWLRHDLVAGLVMTTILVPVGIAYAEASGVPGIDAPIVRPASECRRRSPPRPVRWCVVAAEPVNEKLRLMAEPGTRT